MYPYINTNFSTNPHSSTMIKVKGKCKYIVIESDDYNSLISCIKNNVTNKLFTCYFMGNILDENNCNQGTFDFSDGTQPTYYPIEVVIEE